MNLVRESRASETSAPPPGAARRPQASGPSCVRYSWPSPAAIGRRSRRSRLVPRLLRLVARLLRLVPRLLKMVSSSGPKASPTFGLRLIDVDTDVPLTEYQDSTLATWVAGEADQEYWIEVSVTGADEAQHMKAVIEVDIKPIGYNRRMTGNRTLKVGVYRRDRAPGEAIAQNALALASIPPSSSEGGREGSQQSFGTVTVRFYDVVPTGQKKAGISTGKRFEGACGVGPHASDKKKEGIGMLKSALGSATIPGNHVTTHVWETRGLLQELTIRYSTRFGLVVRRIISEQRVDDSDPHKVGPLRLARQRARAQQSGGASDAPISLLDDEDEVAVEACQRPIKQQAVSVV